MGFVRGVHRLSGILDKIMEAVIVFMLLAMVAVTGAQVVCRIAGHALSWSEEMTRYLLIWSSMLGAGCVYKHSGHISIEVLQNAMPPKVKKAMKILVQVLCIILFAMIVVFGYQYYQRQGNQVSAAMKVPMRFVYLAIPIGCGTMFVHALDALFSLITGKGEAEDSVKEAESSTPAAEERKADRIESGTAGKEEE